MLKLLGIKVEYVYIRTKKELEYFIKDYEDLNYKYLHISCHGNDAGIGLTYDETITFKELDSMFDNNQTKCKKRLFFSSCSVMQANLSEELKKAGFLSIIGPLEEISFQDATIFWAAFYQLVFRNKGTLETITMKQDDVNYALEHLSETFDLEIGAHFRYKNSSKGYKKVHFMKAENNERIKVIN